LSENTIADTTPTVAPPSSSPAPSPEETERTIVGTVNMPASHVRIRPSDEAPVDLDRPIEDQHEERQAFVDRQRDEGRPKLSKSQARSLLDEVERPALRHMVSEARAQARSAMADVDEAQALVDRVDPQEPTPLPPAGQQPIARDPGMPDIWGDELAPAWNKLSPQERAHFTAMTEAQKQWATGVVGELQRAQQTQVNAEQMAIAAATAMVPALQAYGVNSAADYEALNAADPQRAQEYLQLYQTAQSLMQQGMGEAQARLAQEHQYASQQQAEAFHQWGSEQDALFRQHAGLRSEADHDALSKAAFNTLASVGYSREEIADGWNTNPVLRDARTQLLIAKAAQYDTMVAKARSARPTQPHKPLAPGTSNPDGGSGNSLERAAADGNMREYIRLRNKGRVR
jgi:hypothetical protein